MLGNENRSQTKHPASCNRPTGLSPTTRTVRLLLFRKGVDLLQREGGHLLFERSRTCPGRNRIRRTPNAGRAEDSAAIASGRFRKAICSPASMVRLYSTKRLHRSFVLANVCGGKGLHHADH